MYLISSVLLISWQPKKLCLFTIHNNQIKYNKAGIYTDSSTLTYTITRHTRGGGVFCRTRQQTLFDNSFAVGYVLSWVFPFPFPCSLVLQTQKLETHLLRTQVSLLSLELYYSKVIWESLDFVVLL